MTVLALTLPLARSSPLHIARRDIVADAADDLTLQISVVADDTPGAAATSLAAADTTVQLLLWYAPHWRDYGLPYVAGRQTLYTAAGSIAAGTGGRVDVVLPRSAGDLWPPRLGYTLRLDLGGTARTTLAYGALHLPRVYA
jgi:hypothetical protein